MIRILLADDHTILRDGLRFLLQTDSNIIVVGDAENGHQAVEQALLLSPDVVIMDISMPEMNGIKATQVILQQRPNIRIIILSMQSSVDHVFHALQAGALGYLLKDSAGKEVINAVRTVAEGKRYFSQPITETLVGDYLQARGNHENKDQLNQLSEREREILLLVADGYSSAEIGKALFLSPKTVETYRSRLMKKLKVTDLAGLIRFAIQSGVIKEK